MNELSFKHSWEAFCNDLNASIAESKENPEPPDLQHLEAIGAHPDLIAAARFQHISGALNLAPNANYRKYSPDWMFKNSAAIGDDGIGNYILWMDVSRLDSPVLFVCHDDPEVAVIAETPNQFLDNLRSFWSDHPSERADELVYAYMENWETQRDRSSSLEAQSSSTKDIFDFRSAKPGQSVSLTHRGKHTIASEGEKPGILVLSTESDEVIRRDKRRSRIATIALLAVSGLLFSFFYIVLDMSVVASLGMAFVSLVVAMLIFGQAMDAYFTWKDKSETRGGRKR